MRKITKVTLVLVLFTVAFSINIKASLVNPVLSTEYIDKEPKSKSSTSSTNDSNPKKTTSEGDDSNPKNDPPKEGDSGVQTQGTTIKLPFIFW